MASRASRGGTEEAGCRQRTGLSRGGQRQGDPRRVAEFNVLHQKVGASRHDRRKGERACSRQCLGATGEPKLTVESRSALSLVLTQQDPQKFLRTVFPNRAPPNSCRMASSRPKHSVGRLTTSNHDETTREHPKSIQSIQKPSVSIQSAKRVGPARRLSNALLFASKEAVGRCTTRRVTHECAR